MDKRSFLKNAFLASAGAVIASNGTLDASSGLPTLSTGEQPPFLQPALGYAYNALEPYIDAQTMELHYSKHHAAYTKNFNAAIADQKINAASVEAIFSNISHYSNAVRNNGGGYYNHNMYFNIMAPGAGGEPIGDLAQKINESFGSFAKFKEDFSKAGTTVFGSGWVWLIMKDGKLQITTTPNQDNPLMDITPVKGKPVLCMDVWEHAYYLHYQNRRPEYISAFWNVVSWNQVAKYMNQK